MPQLTETEKQDILRYLEADKPLPEKYRFLLFDVRQELFCGAFQARLRQR